MFASSTPFVSSVTSRIIHLTGFTQMSDQVSNSSANLPAITNEDARQLDLLGLCHYVMGGLLALFGCCPVIHLVIGVVLMAGGFPVHEPQPDFRPNYQNSQSQRLDTSPSTPAAVGQSQQPLPSPIADALAVDTNRTGHVVRNSRQTRERKGQVFAGAIFTVLALGMIITSWIVAALVVLAGKSLKQRKRHTFCMIVAGIECLFMPLGTVLGVFSLVVLTRPSVKALFAQSGNGQQVSNEHANVV